MSKYGVFSVPYFPTFGLNKERYSVSLHIQSKSGKIQARKNSVFGNVSHNSWDKVKKSSKYEKNPKTLISAST